MNEHKNSRPDHNIWPGLSSADPLALRAWLAKLGFTEGAIYFADAAEDAGAADPAGRAGGDTTNVAHSEMLWPEGGRVMISSTTKPDDTFVVTPGTANLYVVTDEPDAVHARARELGARFLRELREEDYGSRGFSIVDPDGNAWSFGTYAG